MTAELTHFIRGYQDFCSDQGQPSKAAMFAKVIDVLNRADLSPFAAMAMRDAAMRAIDRRRDKVLTAIGSAEYQSVKYKILGGKDELLEDLTRDIAALPLPAAPDLLAAARHVPEVAAMMAAAKSHQMLIRFILNHQQWEWTGEWRDSVGNGCAKMDAAFAAIGGAQYKHHGTVAMLMALRADLDLEQMQGEEALECINALKDSRDAMQAALDRAEADKAAAVEAAAQIAQDKSSKLLAKADRVKGGRWRSVSSPCTDGFSPSRG